MQDEEKKLEKSKKQDKEENIEVSFNKLAISKNNSVTRPVGDELLQKMDRPKISIDELMKNSEFFISTVLNLDLQVVSWENYQQYMKTYKDLKALYANPILVANAHRYGGLRVVYKKYFEEDFLKASRHLAKIGRHLRDKEIKFDPIELTSNEYKGVVKGFDLVARQLKLKSAYAGFRYGKKFQKSGAINTSKISVFRQTNPIAELSKNNLKALKNQLKKNGQANKLYGLRDDEEQIFKLLLNLPWRCQHATDFFYPIANAGSLDSYQEILRAKPKYVSPFSTKGNIDKLGNGGFVFFRVFVDGVNSTQSRYGASRIFAPLSFFSQIGCVSLHDQLIPFTSKNEMNMRVGKRLLRRAETINIKNTTKEKSLRDGIQYRYRTTPIPSANPLGGKKDTIKNFNKKGGISTQTRKTSFTAEIFYGPDILLGISLSIIRELRCLELCGYRAYFLKELYTANQKDQVMMLGELVKSLFRIEAKYPVSLRLSHTNNELIYHFEPLINQRNDDKKLLNIDNPKGEGQFNSDLSINEEAMKLVLLKQERYRLKNEFSVLRRQAKNTRLKKDTLLNAKKALSALEHRYELVISEINRIENKRGKTAPLIRPIHDISESDSNESGESEESSETGESEDHNTQQIHSESESDDLNNENKFIEEQEDLQNRKNDMISQFILNQNKYWYDSKEELTENTSNKFLEAIILDHFRHLDLLLQEYDNDLPKINSLLTERHQTLLHIAALNHSVSCVRLLLKKKIFIDATDHWEETALHNAVYKNDIEIARILLEAGADPDKPNSVGLSPYHIAIAHLNFPMCELLFHYGADLSVAPFKDLVQGFVVADLLDQVYDEAFRHKNVEKIENLEEFVLELIRMLNYGWDDPVDFKWSINKELMNDGLREEQLEQVEELMTLVDGKAKLSESYPGFEYWDEESELEYAVSIGDFELIEGLEQYILNDPENIAEVLESDVFSKFIKELAGPWIENATSTQLRNLKIYAEEYNNDFLLQELKDISISTDDEDDSFSNFNIPKTDEKIFTFSKSNFIYAECIEYCLKHDIEEKFDGSAKLNEFSLGTDEIKNWVEIQQSSTIIENRNQLDNELKLNKFFEVLKDLEDQKTLVCVVVFKDDFSPHGWHFTLLSFRKIDEQIKLLYVDTFGNTEGFGTFIQNAFYLCYNKFAEFIGWPKLAEPMIYCKNYQGQNECGIQVWRNALLTCELSNENFNIGGLEEKIIEKKLNLEETTTNYRYEMAIRLQNDKNFPLETGIEEIKIESNLSKIFDKCDKKTKEMPINQLDSGENESSVEYEPVLKKNVKNKNSSQQRGKNDEKEEVCNQFNF